MHRDPLDTNRSFLYGDGFFESIRRKDGAWLFLEEHLARMRSSAMLFDLNIPFENRDDLARVCDQQVRGNPSDLVLRLTVYRIGYGLYTPERPYETGLHYLIRSLEAEDDGYFPAENISTLQLIADISELDPITASISTGIRKPIGAFHSVKSTSAAIYSEALIAERNRISDEIILINELGRVCECSSSNLLVQFGGKLFTPPPEDGPVRGTFLDWLKSRHKVDLRSFQPEQLYWADALYRCNAVRGIQRLKLI
ncbi:MAG: aminotransferase class IV [Flavobacteriales bacterium]|nr:aminotransferase class IV [Flavobacteriales bacterium]